MLGRVVAEREQLVLIAGDLGCGLGELRAVGGSEGLHGRAGVVLVLGVPDLREGLLRAGVRGLGQGAEHISDFVEPAALFPGFGEHLAQRLPAAQRAVPRGQHRGAHAAACAVAQQVSPRLRGFAVPVGQGDELRAAVGADPDHHQQAQLVLAKADVHVDAVGPHVHIIDAGQVTVHERAGLALPVLGQPGDHRRGQARAGAQELTQGRHEVAGGQAVQVQQRQHLGDLRGLACPWRQDRRGEPHPPARGRVGALVVDPRRGHPDRPGAGHHGARPGGPVAHHQPVTVLITLAREPLDIGVDLGLQRHGEHPAGALADDLIDQRRGRTVRRQRAGQVRDYCKHRVCLPGRRWPAGLA